MPETATPALPEITAERIHFINERIGTEHYFEDKALVQLKIDGEPVAAYGEGAPGPDTPVGELGPREAHEAAVRLLPQVVERAYESVEGQKRERRALRWVVGVLSGAALVAGAMSLMNEQEGDEVPTIAVTAGASVAMVALAETMHARPLRRGIAAAQTNVDRLEALAAAHGIALDNSEADEL